MSSDYQVIYGVNLLDDLHNYFPELLYNQGRFNNVHSIFHYVRSQMHSRFNLYSYGARQFRATAPAPIPPTPPVQFPYWRQPQPQPQVRPPAREQDVFDNLGAANILLTLFGAGLGQERRAAEDVIVRPSQQVIDSNTTLIAGISGQRCAICQDEIRSDENCRRLNACNHLFHRNCIEPWFERSVRCPTCRHDIREPIIAPAPAPAPAFPSTIHQFFPSTN
jgi:hypothetical protein